MRKAFLVIPVLFLLALTACGGGSSTSTNNNQPPPPPPINGAMTTVDFGTTHQTIRGFGGAESWMPTSTLGPAINALFGTGSNQIGLSIFRIRIDPSSTSAGTQWDNELTNAKNAINAGSNVSIMATPWTPPPTWKINIPDVTNPVAEGSLNPTDYANYANYLASYVTYAANKGVNLYAISMQNEPDANVTYESCAWTPAEMDAWVAQLPAGLFGSTKLIMPESEGFNTAFSDPALNDLNAVGKIGVIGGHIYGTAPTAYPAAVAAGKELWMTEHFLSPSGAQPAIADALAAAKEIHDSMTIGQYNAYVWWWAIDWNPGGGVTNYGLVDTSSNPNYYGWAMAQFSRFVRPGYVRVDAAYSTPNVYVSAYSGAGHSVIVAINIGTSDVSQPFTIKNQAITSLLPYQTTATATVAQQASVNVSGGQFTYILPAQSITTFVQ